MNPNHHKQLIRTCALLFAILLLFTSLPTADVPKTGDHSGLLLWSALLTTAVGSLLAIRKRMRP